MKFTLDLHHVVLYVLLAVVTLSALGVAHGWIVDIKTAKVKEAADQYAIAAIEKDKADRAKQYEAQVQLLNSMRITKPLPPAILVQRLKEVEPALAIVPEQLVSPLPNTPRENLSLTPAQQVVLVNRAIDCKSCEAERAKLRIDLADETNIAAARADEVAAWKVAAKGGSLKQRIKRRLWHFAEDAIIIESLRVLGGHP